MTPKFETALEGLEEYDDGLRDCPMCNGIGDFPFPNAPESIAGKPDLKAGHAPARDGHSVCWHCQGTGLMHRDRIAKIDPSQHFSANKTPC